MTGDSWSDFTRFVEGEGVRFLGAALVWICKEVSGCGAVDDEVPVGILPYGGEFGFPPPGFQRVPVEVGDDIRHA